MSDMEIFNVADQDGGTDKVRRVRSRITTSSLDGVSSTPGSYKNILVSTGEALNLNPDGSFSSDDGDRTFQVV